MAKKEIDWTKIDLMFDMSYFHAHGGHLLSGPEIDPQDVKRIAKRATHQVSELASKSQVEMLQNLPVKEGGSSIN